MCEFSKPSRANSKSRNFVAHSHQEYASGYGKHQDSKRKKLEALKYETELRDLYGDDFDYDDSNAFTLR